MNSDDDQFLYRSEGGSFSVGSDNEDHTSTLIKVNENLLCITRKNISTILLADDIDPDRSNPKIRHNVQHILPYGSDHEFVGKTLQLASVLFKEHSLMKSIDCGKGLSIAFSFLKEITSLEKVKNEYLVEEKATNSKVTSRDSLSQIPSLPNLEQKVKGFVTNSDHAMKSVMEMAHLFYPAIIGKGWEGRLLQEIESTFPAEESFVEFTRQLKGFTELIRNIRNKIEHPHGELKEYIFTIENYKLTPTNTLNPPFVSFTGKDYNLPKMQVSNFMDSTVSNLLIIFELLMVYLSNLRAESFGEDKRIVVEVPENERGEAEKHVRFRYEILWKS